MPGGLRRRAGQPRDAGGGVVPGRAAQLRRAALPRGAPGRDGDRPRVRAAGSLRAELGRPAGHDGARGDRAPPTGRRARRPGGRLHAEHPGDGRRVPRHGEHRRDLVERRARVRRADRDRPLQADRAEGAAGGRRLPLQRQGLRPQRPGGAAPGGDPDPGAHGHGAVSRGRRVGAPGGRPARVRAGAVRPPAVGALLVRHDGVAEGDRAGAGRDPPRAPEEGEPALEPDAGRPLLLVHDDRLDDVELPRGRAARGIVDRALRRRAGARPALAARGRRGGHVLRHERGVHLELHEGERGAAGAAAR